MLLISITFSVSQFDMSGKVVKVKPKKIPFKFVTFFKCSSLSSLPDISKWNTNNVDNMSKMFIYCESLSSLPDISKWNTSNVNDIFGMFLNCESL